MKRTFAIVFSVTALLAISADFSRASCIDQMRSEYKRQKSIYNSRKYRKVLKLKIKTLEVVMKGDFNNKTFNKLYMQLQKQPDLDVPKASEVSQFLKDVNQYDSEICQKLISNAYTLWDLFLEAGQSSSRQRVESLKEAMQERLERPEVRLGDQVYIVSPKWDNASSSMSYAESYGKTPYVVHGILNDGSLVLVDGDHKITCGGKEHYSLLFKSSSNGVLKTGDAICIKAWATSSEATYGEVVGGLLDRTLIVKRKDGTIARVPESACVGVSQTLDSAQKENFESSSPSPLAQSEELTKNTCTICCANEKNISFSCGCSSSQQCCEACVEKLETCPYCREPIQSQEKI